VAASKENAKIKYKKLKLWNPPSADDFLNFAF
jgi:hypothetical protein